MLRSLLPHVDKLKYLANENAPTILTALGVVGTIGTTVLTGRATFKAAKLISEEQLVRDDLAEKDDKSSVELSKTEKTKIVWRIYLPPVASGVLTIACIITANKISSKRIAALTFAAGVSERAFTEYKEKVVEKLGSKQDQKIRDDIAQDRVTANPPSNTLIIGGGKVLCFDQLTGRYFESTMEDIKRAENKVNYELVNYMSCSLSSFYDEIGLAPTTYTDSVGWNTNNRMEVQFSTVLSDNNQPCLAIDFSKPPFPDYDKHWDT